MSTLSEAVSYEPLDLAVPPILVDAVRFRILSHYVMEEHEAPCDEDIIEMLRSVCDTLCFRHIYKQARAEWAVNTAALIIAYRAGQRRGGEYFKRL